MIEGLAVSSLAARSTWLEADANATLYGAKGARLLSLPRQWTPPFLLLTAALTRRLIKDQLTEPEIVELAAALASVSGSDGLIVRSSVVGETIWERGTFHSEPLRREVAASPESFLCAAKKVQSSVGERTLALVVQEFIRPDEQGEFGNLARVSKTRDQWEYSVRSAEPVLQQVRFNSQRDTAAPTGEPLLAKARLSRERLFGSVAAWINNELVRSTNDRVNCEWVRRGDRYFVVQIDREDEDVFGINPMQIYIEPSISVGGSGVLLKAASPAQRAKWDKLAVLDELFDLDDDIIPTLFVLEFADAVEANRDALEKDFESLLGSNIIVRVSVRSDVQKITNLDKTDCATPAGAADWCIRNAQSVTEAYPGVELAFVAHRFIAARSAAWVRADPENPTVEVHGNWGLPDALQFCPYDMWDVHFPAEEITELPAYKSNVLLNSADGKWRYERVRNDVARFQSLTSHQVLDVARRTLRIAQRLGHPCHVMWFVGCKTDDGRETNVPWYRTEAHEIDLPQKRSTHTFTVADGEDLKRVPDLKKKFPGLGVALEPKSQSLLRDNEFLRQVADVVVPLGVPVILGGSTLAHAFFQLRHHKCVVISAGDKDHLRPRRQVSYAKLVRDKIPERIAAQKEKQAVTTAPDEYRLGYLIGKMVEEGLEVREASSDADRLMELADVFEVLRGLVSLFGLNLEGVVAAAEGKREKSGGFETGQLLWETSLPNPRETAGTTEISPEAELLVEQTGPATIRLPFTFLGFAGIGSTRTLQLGSEGVILQFTLLKDAIEIDVRKAPSQLSLDL